MVATPGGPYEPQLDELGHDRRSTFPLLSRAPIIEGLIDIRVKVPEHITLDALRRFHEPIKEQFPQQRERRAVAATVDISGAGISLTQDQQVGGFLHVSQNDAMIVQARRDGFTLSKLHPYVSWSDLQSSAQRLWDLYLQVAEPQLVTRLAVRYINHLRIPGGEDMKEYLRTAPEIAPGIPQVLANFVMQLVLPHPSGAVAVINQSFGEINENDERPVVFDIDVFRELELQPSSAAVWDTLEVLRVYKNRIFFNSVTPKMLEGLK